MSGSDIMALRAYSRRLVEDLPPILHFGANILQEGLPNKKGVYVHFLGSKAKDFPKFRVNLTEIVDDEFILIMVFIEIQSSYR